MYKYFLFFLLTLSVNCQEVDIIPYLQQVEKGEIVQVQTKVTDLMRTNPNDPSVLFLDAVISSDGTIALDKYLSMLQQYPSSKYADAAVFRIYSYYYAIGSYIKARNYFDLLQKDYPNSPYIGFIGNIPNTNETEVLPNNNSQGNNNYKYSIQAGAFLSLNNAESLKQKFQNDGYYSDITEKVVGGSSLNVVRVGRFVTQLEAEQFLTIIESKYQIKGSIISY